MITIEEHKAVVAFILDEKNAKTLLSDSMTDIEKIGTQAGIYYARCNYVLGVMEADITEKVNEQIQKEEKPTMARIEREVEEAVNKDYTVRYKELKRICGSLDKIGMIAGGRRKAREKEDSM